LFHCQLRRGSRRLAVDQARPALGR
jgi:hypothetical protein